MKLNRLDFIKSLEEKQQAYLTAKASADALAEERDRQYWNAVKEYRQEVARLLASGVEYEIHAYHGELTAKFDKDTVLPTPPAKPREDYAFRTPYGGSTDYDFKNRAKLLETLRVSTEVEISLSKQILDLV
jgi:hypothetical protein